MIQQVGCHKVPNPLQHQRFLSASHWRELRWVFSLSLRRWSLGLNVGKGLSKPHTIQQPSVIIHKRETNKLASKLSSWSSSPPSSSTYGKVFVSLLPARKFGMRIALMRKPIWFSVKLGYLVGPHPFSTHSNNENPAPGVGTRAQYWVHSHMLHPWGLKKSRTARLGELWDGWNGWGECCWFQGQFYDLLHTKKSMLSGWFYVRIKWVTNNKNKTDVARIGSCFHNVPPCLQRKAQKYCNVGPAKFMSHLRLCCWG